MSEETPEELAAIIAKEDATPDMVPVITIMHQRPMY